MRYCPWIPADSSRVAHLRVPCTVYRVPSAECRVPCAECRVPSAVCRVPYAVCRVPSAECHVPCAVCRMPYAVCRVPSAECRVPCAVRREPCVVCRVPCAVCRVPVPCATSRVPCAYGSQVPSTEDFCLFHKDGHFNAVVLEKVITWAFGEKAFVHIPAGAVGPLRDDIVDQQGRKVSLYLQLLDGARVRRYYLPHLAYISLHISPHISASDHVLWPPTTQGSSLRLHVSRLTFV